MKTDTKRYWVLDGVRGIALIQMVIFHFLYDVFIVYGYDRSWYGQWYITLWQQEICWTFILVAGLAWHFSRNNWKRGALLNVCGFSVTVVTGIAVPSETVWFGILNFMGCAVWLMIPLDRLLRRLNPYAGAAAAFGLFWLTRPVGNGYLGLGTCQIIRIPEVLYRLKFLTCLGFPFDGFTSGDYFPIFPWFFLFCTGYFLWGIIKRKGWDSALTIHIPAAEAAGRRSLLIYLAHQPVSMAILYLILG